MQKNRTVNSYLNISDRIFVISRVFFIAMIVNGSMNRALSQEYFQQEVNYRLQVKLNDRQHELFAFETIEYINHSPDTLRFIYFHLWPNGYLNNHTELARQLLSSKGKAKLFNDPELNGYIDSLDFKVDDQLVQWILLPNQPDICLIHLNSPVKPGETIKYQRRFM